MATNSTATAFSNQRKLDHCADGTLVTVYRELADNTVALQYSKDGGVTWSAVQRINIGGANLDVHNLSMFIDLDDFLHLVWKQGSSTGGRTGSWLYYARGTPNTGRTAWTWSSSSVAETATVNHPDLIAHREGTGWKAHVVYSNFNATENWTYYRRANIAANGTITWDIASIYGDPISANYAVANVSTYPSIDFHHTGDGKTVAGGTPHVYVGWSAGTTGAGKGLRFKRLAYSAGAWTPGTERTVDDTLYVDGDWAWINCLLVGTRIVVGCQVRRPASTADGNYIFDIDPSTEAVTLRASQLGGAGTGGGGWSDALYRGSMSYDSEGDLYLFGQDNMWPNLAYKKFTRATLTLGARVQLYSEAGNGNPWFSAKRGHSSGRIEWVYTSGNNSPYAVKYDRILVSTPKTDSEVGTATEQQTLAVQAASNDAGTSVEVATLANAVSSSDVAAATETETLQVTHSHSDTGTATETELAASPVESSDTGTSTETEQSLVVQVQSSEVGIALEGATVDAQLLNSDSGISMEDQVLLVSSLSSDTGTVTEAESLETSYPDVGTATETETLVVFLTSSDFGTGSDGSSFVDRVNTWVSNKGKIRNIQLFDGKFPVVVELGPHVELLDSTRVEVV